MRRLLGAVVLVVGVGACKRAPPGLAEQFASEFGCTADRVTISSLGKDLWDASGCGSSAEYDCASGRCVAGMALFDPTGGERAAGTGVSIPGAGADAGSAKP